MDLSFHVSQAEEDCTSGGAKTLRYRDLELIFPFSMTQAISD